MSRNIATPGTFQRRVHMHKLVHIQTKKTCITQHVCARLELQHYSATMLHTSLIEVRKIFLQIEQTA